jgi:hypothetical protein
MSDDRIFQYVVLHSSCRGHAGVAASQAIHAATEALQCLPVPKRTNACILMSETSDGLISLSKRLTKEKIHHVLISEPDPPYNGSATALGLPPMPRSKVKHLMVDDFGQPLQLLIP